jgi:hypothetical protein
MPVSGGNIRIFSGEYIKSRQPYMVKFLTSAQNTSIIQQEG